MSYRRAKRYIQTRKCTDLSSWAPISELYGRKLPLLIAAFGMSIFNLGMCWYPGLSD